MVNDINGGTGNYDDRIPICVIRILLNSLNPLQRVTFNKCFFLVCYDISPHGIRDSN